jgi:hypothetical protein
MNQTIKEVAIQRLYLSEQSSQYTQVHKSCCHKGVAPVAYGASAAPLVGEDTNWIRRLDTSPKNDIST